MKSIVKQAKTVDEAISLGLSELDLTRDQVDIKVLEEPTKKFFGLLGYTDALVEITVISVTKDISVLAKDFLESVFKAMDIEANFNIETKKNNLSIDIIDINSKDMGVIIGKRGSTLDSLQYLLSLVINKETDKYIRVNLNVGNYREKREETLKTLARNMADRTRNTKRPVKLEPMNAYERKVIHFALQNQKDIKTYSEGKEPFRRIVIENKQVENPLN